MSVGLEPFLEDCPELYGCNCVIQAPLKHLEQAFHALPTLAYVHQLIGLKADLMVHSLLAAEHERADVLAESCEPSVSIY